MTPDTSVVVAAFVRWHERHAIASEALQDCSALVGHVAIEAYSVLTGLPGGRHLSGTQVNQLLGQHFPFAWLTLASEQLVNLLDLCAAAEVRGAASYDALVAATATENGHELATADRRAAATYKAVGVRTLVL